MVTQVQLATKIQFDTVGVPKYVQCTRDFNVEARRARAQFGTYFDRGFFVADRLFYILQSTSDIWEQSGCSNITNHTLAPLIMSDLFPIFEHLDRLTALYGLYRQF